MTRRRPEARGRSLAEIQARKRALVERAAAERVALARHTAALGPVLSAGDRVAGFFRGILAHPLLLAAAAGALLALRPRAVLRTAARGFALWNGVRAVRRFAAPK